MAWSYYIYTSLSYEELQALEEEYSKAFTAFLETNDEILDCEEGTGLVFAEKDPPSIEEIKSTLAEFEIELPANYIERLSQCKTTLQIESPVSPEKSRLQVSTLVYLLERVGQGVMDWGDYQLQFTESALKKISKYKHFGRMGEEPKKEEEEHHEPTPTGPGVERAGRIVDLLHAAEDNPELALDLGKLIKRQPPKIQQYLAHLLHDGIMNDNDAIKKIGMKKAEFSEAMKKLEAMLDEITSHD